MKLFTSIMNTIDTVLNRFLQALLLVVTVVVTWQVFSRYVLNSPSSFTEELARFLLIWITLLGCVYAYRQKSHLGLDMVYTQASLFHRKWMFYVIHLCVLSFAICIMIIGGFSLMNMTEQLGQSSPVMGIDISLVYSVVPFSGFLIVLYGIHTMLNPDYHGNTHDEFAHSAIVESTDTNSKKDA